MVSGIKSMRPSSSGLRSSIYHCSRRITTLTFASRRLGFSRADEITIVFCGSKKSLANGVPIATLLFAGHVGLVIMPVMVFQQIQLMVCASLARRYAARQPLAVPPVAASLKVT
jgi:sodium/bile acid cotransporter 7